MQGLQRVRAVLMRERERERARAHFMDMMGRLCRTWASLFWCDCLVWADSCIRVELRQVAMKQEGESLTAEHLCMLGANILGRTAAARSIRAPHCHHPPRAAYPDTPGNASVSLPPTAPCPLSAPRKGSVGTACPTKPFVFFCSRTSARRSCLLLTESCHSVHVKDPSRPCLA